MSLVETACSLWTVADLPSLQSSMDEAANTIQTNQGKSLDGRKQLASQTKEFKSLNDELKLDQLNSLLKCYQKEIDSLNKRNKLVESSFFKIYRGLAEVPDPVPLLQETIVNSKSSKRIEALELENKDLQGRLLKYADYDTLKGKIERNSKDFEVSIEKKVKLNDDKWSGVLQEKEMNWQKDQAKLDATIDSLKSKLQEFELNEKMLKKKLQNNEIPFDDDNDEENITSNDDSVEVNLLKRELDEFKSNSTILQKRNEDLRMELINANSKSDLEIQNFKHSQRNEHSDLESEIALISAKLDHERSQNLISQNKLKDLDKSSKSQMDNLKLEITNLKSIKEQTSDYNEIKRELEILRQIQFGDNDSDSALATSSTTTADFNTGVDPIESAIVQRNKKLHDDLVEFRNKSETLQTQLTQSNKKISEMGIELEKLKSANSNLEHELMNLDGSSRGGAIGGDKWETMSMISSIVPAKRNGTISPAASIAGGMNEGSIIQGPTSSAGNGDSTLLPLITQQRDRFRLRNRELEEENKKHFSKLMEMKREVSTLKNDNKELFEKIQFLKFHNDSSNTKKSTVDERYEEDYERQLHPIEKFRLMETKRISSKISPWERIFIQITKTVLSTQYTRWLFVGYCATLHLLVMLLGLHLIGSSPEPIISQSAINSATGGKSG